MTSTELKSKAVSLAQQATDFVDQTDPKHFRRAGDVCAVAGFASIIASIVAWGIKKGGDTDAKAERLGIFIGLWAPTFFILSNRLEHYAERAEQGKLTDSVKP
jgi:hypothetical protein